MLTPCIGVCTLGPNGLCDGCFRTGDEIARWTTMGDPARAHLMDVVLPERELRGGRTGSGSASAIDLPA